MHYPFLSGDKFRPKFQHFMVGAKGEEIAAGYLVSIGYEVREKNVRLGYDEIDLIAWDPQDQVLVFAEVKSRTEETREGYRPELKAGAKKRRSLRRAARHWVANNDFDGGYRIDLLCVEAGRVKHHFKELSWD